MVHCMHAYSPCSDTNYCVLCLSIIQIGDNQQPAHGCLQEGQGVGGGGSLADFIVCTCASWADISCYIHVVYKLLRCAPQAAVCATWLVDPDEWVMTHRIGTDVTSRPQAWPKQTTHPAVSYLHPWLHGRKVTMLQSRASVANPDENTIINSWRNHFSPRFDCWTGGTRRELCQRNSIESAQFHNMPKYW